VHPRFFETADLDSHPTVMAPVDLCRAAGAGPALPKRSDRAGRRRGSALCGSAGTNATGEEGLPYQSAGGRGLPDISRPSRSTK
jgi:hypothetical protein